MKLLLLLFASSIILLSSCDGGRPPIHIPEGFFDTISPKIYDPYEPDSICMYDREPHGTILGEWMEVARVEGSIISEMDCITIDTTDFSTRRQKRWVFKNDSVVETYGQDVTIKNDSTHIILSGENGQSWKYRMKGVNDTILMVDSGPHMYYDTLRITRLEADTLILSSVRYLWAFKPPVVKSVVYIRRK